MSYVKEKDMYNDIINSLSSILSLFGYKYTIYKTWETFDYELKSIYPNVFSILNKDAMPDLTVIYYDSLGIRRCLIVEVKHEDLVVKDIAQAKIYGEIFDADAVLLVSLKKIRKSFIEFSSINKYFLTCSNGSQLYTCTLENGILQIQTCFPSKGGIIK